MGAVQREGENIVLYLDIENKLEEPLTGFQIRFDNNPYKIQPTNMVVALPGVRRLLPRSILCPREALEFL